MTIWLGVGFVLLLSALGLIDLRNTKRAVAKLVGAIAILGAAAPGTAAAYAVLTLTSPPAAPAILLAVCGAAVLVGAVADVLGELRTRSFVASATVTAFTWLLPRSVGDTPNVGAVSFVAAICILIASVSGVLFRRIAVDIMYPAEDEEAGEPGGAGDA